MRIAVPLADERLCMHFGHCETFALVDVVDGKIAKRTDVVPPPHEPGVLPRWLAAQGVTMIIAGGMGQRAQGLFTENRIQVVVGAPSESPEKLIAAYLEGNLQTGENVCDH
ncbi:MAG TPA: NifB/NifX family molybdenum-iron cluster-binding protein [bacterium]|nr:NifB/NifX family molybdenum-iron cluster-binding protein [bacterium]